MLKCLKCGKSGYPVKVEEEEEEEEEKEEEEENLKDAEYGKTFNNL